LKRTKVDLISRAICQHAEVTADPSSVHDPTHDIVLSQDQASQLTTDPRDLNAELDVSADLHSNFEVCEKHLDATQEQPNAVPEISNGKSVAAAELTAAATSVCSPVHDSLPHTLPLVGSKPVIESASVPPQRVNPLSRVRARKAKRMDIDCEWLGSTFTREELLEVR